MEKRTRYEFFKETRYHRPICNHSINDIGAENIGYTFGIFGDGIPFEADLWKLNGETTVSFYLPDVAKLVEGYTPVKNLSTDMPFEISTEVVSKSVLGIGMAIRTPENAYDEKPYIDYLERVGAVTFENRVMNGGVEYYTDIEGNDIVCIHISLDGIEGGHVETTLHFMPFPGTYNKSNIKPKIIEIDFAK